MSDRDDRLRRSTEQARISEERAAAIESDPDSSRFARISSKGEAEGAERQAANAFRARFKEKTGLGIDHGELGKKWSELFK